MKAKNQRLLLALFAIIAIIGAGFLALSALQDKAAYFYTPTDIAAGKVEVGKAMRLGGMVQAGSIRRDPKTMSVNFIVVDGAHETPVTFYGITPDLFKENSGAVAEGTLEANGTFVATNVLAKHDEKYVPPEMAAMKQMKKAESQ